MIMNGRTTRKVQLIEAQRKQFCAASKESLRYFPPIKISSIMFSSFRKKEKNLVDINSCNWLSISFGCIFSTLLRVILFILIIEREHKRLLSCADLYQSFFLFVIKLLISTLKDSISLDEVINKLTKKK